MCPYVPYVFIIKTMCPYVPYVFNPLLGFAYLKTTFLTPLTTEFSIETAYTP